jgi:hypothetical protein
LEIQWRRTIEAEAQAESSLASSKTYGKATLERGNVSWHTEEKLDCWKENLKKPIGIRALRPKMRYWSNVFHQRSALTGSRKNPLGKGRVPKLELSS